MSHYQFLSAFVPDLDMVKVRLKVRLTIAWNENWLIWTLLISWTFPSQPNITKYEIVKSDMCWVRVIKPPQLVENSKQKKNRREREWEGGRNDAGQVSGSSILILREGLKMLEAFAARKFATLLSKHVHDPCTAAQSPEWASDGWQWQPACCCLCLHLAALSPIPHHLLSPFSLCAAPQPT